jgi:hypothetical protein
VLTWLKKNGQNGTDKFNVGEIQLNHGLNYQFKCFNNVRRRQFCECLIVKQLTIVCFDVWWAELALIFGAVGNPAAVGF